MEDLSAPAKALLEGRGAHRHDHKFLRVHGVGRMGTAVQDIHHGNWKAIAVYTTQETIERHAERYTGCPGSSNGDRQNGVGTKVGFILCAICLEHGGIDSIGIRGINSIDSAADFLIHMIYGLCDALAKIAGLVPVSQFQRLKFSGGCAGRCSSLCNGSVGQCDLCLNGGVAAGVEDLSSLYIYYVAFAH